MYLTTSTEVSTYSPTLSRHDALPTNRLDQVLDAPDADRLLQWLRQQRLAWRDPRHPVLLIHAGLAPQWTQRQTLQLATEVERELRDPSRFRCLVSQLSGNDPHRLSDALRGPERLRSIAQHPPRARF